MGKADAAASAATHGFAVVAIALAGFVFSLTPLAERADEQLLDLEWSLLRKFAPREAPDDMIIVGIDEGSVQAIGVPPGLWHEPIGRALERIALARPRAIGIDFPLPERSFESFHPGLDRALGQGLAAARSHAVLVASLSIDARTRGARPIHAPFLAILGEQGLGIGLLGRDGDGVTRRFSLAVPTEDGSFPTLAGRLCRRLGRACSDGLIDYALGAPFKYVPLRDVLATRDEQYLDKLFRDRIVMLGDVRPADRVDVPVDLAGWEPGGRTSPTVVVQSQSLRTALAGAPSEASRPLGVLILGFAALVALVRDWRMAALTALLAAACLFAAGTAVLRAGTYVGLSAPLLTLALAVAARVALARRK
jgi:CHASE2 domain-containing sensor protein